MAGRSYAADVRVDITRIQSPACPGMSSWCVDPGSHANGDFTLDSHQPKQSQPSSLAEQRNLVVSLYRAHTWAPFAPYSLFHANPSKRTSSLSTGSAFSEAR